MDKTIGSYKIALISICLNEPYWQYISPMIASAKQFLLQGHQVDYLLWSDMPENADVGATKIFPTDSCPWPLPTLFRYHLFLQQEELLKNYDFIFYCDADMLFVSRVGDEILPTKGGLTGAQHPMYALRKEYCPPYEPNPLSSSYIPRPGRIIEVGGQKRLEPLYFAGGFQGGSSIAFIEAMKTIKGYIDTDFVHNNYIPIWNDESAWNKYLFLNPPEIVLSPSYVYPDSLNKAYYQKVWGKNYVPRLITLTKPFSLSKDSGATLQNKLKTI